MHERDRHRVIVEMLQRRPVATVRHLVAATAASEATIRRDLTVLARQGRLRKVRGGAEAIRPNAGGVDPEASAARHLPQKRAIARRAAALCSDGEAIIVNGGSTTFQLVHALRTRRLQVLTNSFAIADHLLHHSHCTVFVPFGAVYRRQNIILSPFEQDGTPHFRASRMFMGAQGVSPLGLMETDAPTIQSEQRLMRQADRLIVLVDASKFAVRSSLILAPLTRAHTIITDDRIETSDRVMIEDAGVELIVVAPEAGDMDEIVPWEAP